MRKGRWTRRNLMLGLAFSIIVLVLAMVVVTAYYVPKTYRTIVDETFQEEGSFTFVVELEYDQNCHVYAQTDQRGTYFNITLLGYPIISSGPPLMLDESTVFMYNWTVRAHEPPVSAGSGYGFDIAPWNNYGDKWKLGIQLVGNGELHLTISSFDRSSYNIFFYTDLVAIVGILLIIVTYTYRFKLAKYNNNQQL